MAKRIPRPGFTFPGPVPKEALNFFRGKELKIGFSYQDVWREEHACSFTVAKAMEVDILQDIRTALDTALAEGQTLRQFQKGLKPLLEKKGWWGIADVVDTETGEIAEGAQLGSPRRLKTIYDANMRTARAAGQWDRIQRTKDALPYLLRTLGPSETHRQQHVVWHGTLLPADDPWWDSHFCPSGYGCKCRIRQVGEYEAGKLKEKGIPAADRKQLLNPETGLPTGRMKSKFSPVITDPAPDVMRPWKNKRTGVTHMIPEGIDPGWDHNPAKYRQQNLQAMLDGKLQTADPAIAAAAKKDLAVYRQETKS